MGIMRKAVIGSLLVGAIAMAKNNKAKKAVVKAGKKAAKSAKKILNKTVNKKSLKLALSKRSK